MYRKRREKTHLLSQEVFVWMTSYTQKKALIKARHLFVGKSVWGLIKNNTDLRLEKKKPILIMHYSKESKPYKK